MGCLSSTTETKTEQQGAETERERGGERRREREIQTNGYRRETDKRSFSQRACVKKKRENM